MAVVGTPRRSISGTLTRRLDRLSERNFAILVSVPALLLVAIFVLPPILAVFGFSFFRIELAKDDLTPFVGLRNFLERLPIDDVVLASIPRTLGFAAAVTAVTIPLALLTAMILNRPFRGSGVFLMARDVAVGGRERRRRRLLALHLRHPLRHRERHPHRAGPDP